MDSHHLEQDPTIDRSRSSLALACRNRRVALPISLEASLVLAGMNVTTVYACEICGHVLPKKNAEHGKYRRLYLVVTATNENLPARRQCCGL